MRVSARCASLTLRWLPRLRSSFAASCLLVPIPGASLVSVGRSSETWVRVSWHGQLLPRAGVARHMRHIYHNRGPLSGIYSPHRTNNWTLLYKKAGCRKMPLKNGLFFFISPALSHFLAFWYYRKARLERHGRRATRNIWRRRGDFLSKRKFSPPKTAK